MYAFSLEVLGCLGVGYACLGVGYAFFRTGVNLAKYRQARRRARAAEPYRGYRRADLLGEIDRMRSERDDYFEQMHQYREKLRRAEAKIARGSHEYWDRLQNWSA